ncbi:DUF2975 domain-containing protein [Flavobacterium sp. AG291]|uniref:DUF2975 domain-containing protein n=1 Tax=Flavobacterium sp. AG291 TaxID=2184000 RepID=UPI000E0ABC08|nr:DUF2975 domain-containing protein [Flavobacterium sp. AG291]RDI08593.1 DUF2975 family protein [Flavobacterium sp. AG291]
MTQLRTLKLLVQILFALSLILMFFLIPFMLLSIVTPESIPFKINGEMAKDISVASKLTLFIVVAGFASFLYALYIFKQILILFEKKKVFDTSVITNFKKIGRIIYGGGVLLIIGSVSFRLTQGEAAMDLDFIIDLIFIFALGLFFEVLSGVFQWAKNLKEENDLTV